MWIAYKERDMAQGNIEMTVRVISPKTSVIDINGDFTAAAESVLMDAYTRACAPTTRSVIFNFSGLEYMNSSGIGLLVTFLIRANRQKQKVMAYGLSEHYRHIFELTRLNEAIHVYDSELAAIDAA
jgi:anti-sigma B factor antagonist